MGGESEGRSVDPVWKPRGLLGQLAMIGVLEEN